MERKKGTGTGTGDGRAYFAPGTDGWRVRVDASGRVWSRRDWKAGETEGAEPTPAGLRADVGRARDGYLPIVISPSGGAPRGRTSFVFASDADEGTLAEAARALKEAIEADGGAASVVGFPRRRAAASAGRKRRAEAIAARAREALETEGIWGAWSDDGAAAGAKDAPAPTYELRGRGGETLCRGWFEDDEKGAFVLAKGARLLGAEDGVVVSPIVAKERDEARRYGKTDGARTTRDLKFVNYRGAVAFVAGGTSNASGRLRRISDGTRAVDVKVEGRERATRRRRASDGILAPEERSWSTVDDDGTPTTRFRARSGKDGWEATGRYVGGDPRLGFVVEAGSTVAPRADEPATVEKDRFFGSRAEASRFAAGDADARGVKWRAPDGTSAVAYEAARAEAKAEAEAEAKAKAEAEAVRAPAKTVPAADGGPEKATDAGTARGTGTPRKTGKPRAAEDRLRPAPSEPFGTLGGVPIRTDARGQATFDFDAAPAPAPAPSPANGETWPDDPGEAGRLWLSKARPGARHDDCPLWRKGKESDPSLAAGLTFDVRLASGGARGEIAVGPDGTATLARGSRPRPIGEIGADATKKIGEEAKKTAAHVNADGVLLVDLEFEDLSTAESVAVGTWGGYKYTTIEEPDGCERSSYEVCHTEGFRESADARAWKASAAFDRETLEVEVEVRGIDPRGYVARLRDHDADRGAHGRPIRTDVGDGLGNFAAAFRASEDGTRWTAKVRAARAPKGRLAVEFASTDGRSFSGLALAREAGDAAGE